MGLHGTVRGVNWMLQQMGAWLCRNGNVRLSACAVKSITRFKRAHHIKGRC